ncbi:unnamed protein product [Peniophora sp. CBMAI 1063]|nr:unnamed protein product [Peniophora sp. CBMAI 1063]
MASPLSGNGEDLLQAALSDAFSVGTLPHEPVLPASSPSPPSDSSSPSDTPSLNTDTSSTSTRPDVDAEPLTPEALEASKLELESHLAKWKAENAEQREAAENKRASWARIREEESRKGVKSVNEVKEAIAGPPTTGASTSSEGWERLLASGRTGRDSPSPVDGRDLVGGEKGGKRTEEELARILPGSTSNEHKKSPSSAPWEDVPSELTSSFPSLSFPEDSNPHSHQASGSDTHHQHHHAHHDHAHHHHGDKTSSATLTIFDSTLSTRTRVWALVGAVGINLLLPFVNGVMLGFGEIFAKDVVMGWLGWGKGTSGVGLRTGSRRRS